MVFLGDSVLLFGGRGNNKVVEHRPMTFEIDEQEGELQFKSYDNFELTNCTGVSNEICDKYPNVEVGEYNNDVWKFHLKEKYECENTNASASNCVEEGKAFWKQIDPGAQFGGCILAFGTELCTHPAERYNHAAAIYHERYMMIYGGYSPWCTDYCDDVWLFDTVTYMWSKIGEDASSEGAGGGGPGKRWKSANVYENNEFFMFGGHRMEDEESKFLNDFWKLSLGDIDDGAQSIVYNIGVHIGGSVTNWELLGTDKYFLSVSGDAIESWNLAVSQDDASSRSKWRIRRLDSSIERDSNNGGDDGLTCVDVLLAAAVGDLEEEVTCNPETSRRIVVEVQSVETSGFVGYTPFLGMYLSRISEPLYTSFVLENIGRNGFIMYPINSNVLKYVEFDVRNASVQITNAFAGWSLGDQTEESRLFFRIVSEETKWERFRKKSMCFPSPGETWQERSNIECKALWPPARALAAFVHVNTAERHRMYLHGGYRVLLPYPDDDPAIFTQSYPLVDRYLDDLWMYSLDNGYWNLVNLPGAKPSPRYAHTILNVPFGRDENILLLFGGYRSNVFYQDIWEYRVKLNAWREKSDFTIPIYPHSCTRDGQEAVDIWEKETFTDVEQYTDRQCFALGGTNIAPYDSIPPISTPCVFPNVYAGREWSGCIPGSVHPPEPLSKAQAFTFEYLEEFPWCITTPLGAYPIRWGYCHCSSCNDYDDHYPCCKKDKDAPGIVAPSTCCQIATNVPADSSALLAAPESVCDQALDLFDCWDDVCYAGESDFGNKTMSVWGQPMRFDSDLFPKLRGRQLHIRQPRRQRPGWDGCRDRYDRREDMPNKLMWEQPSQRWNHAAIFNNDTGIMLLTGGIHFPRPELASFDKTPVFEAVFDTWAYDINKCAHDCNGHGDCVLGYCFCESGYYGLDCSNTSCPGDYCYYDPVTWKHVCRHCCSKMSVLDPANNVFEQLRARKIGCSATEDGVENGICDGFGHCQCRPPMVGDDCSIRDCPNDCSAHGVCALEYPQARCICDPKWTGEDCSSITCLNNCSYPWGQCDDGTCRCKDIMNPYNNTMVYAQYEGPDCSYVTPYAASARAGANARLVAVALISMAHALLSFS
eukprot:g25.t1